MRASIFSIMFFSTIILLLSGCKKDKKNSATSNCQSNCYYYTNLKNHKWIGIHYFEDSSFAAINAPLSMPLTTTFDYFDPNDICTNTSRIWFRPDGERFRIYDLNCTQHPGDTVAIGPWILNGPDNNVLTTNSGIMKVMMLTADTLKLHYISTLHLSGGDSIQYSHLWVMLSDD